MGTSSGKILTYKDIDADPDDVRRVQEIETNFQPRAMRVFNTDPSVKQLVDREMILVQSDTRYIAVRVGDTLYKLGMSEAGNFVKLEGDTMTGQLGSTVVTGTAPMDVASLTLNTNFNADMVDGQHLSVTDTPTFDGVILSSLTANRLVSSDGTKALVSVAALTAWVTGTTNQIIVTDDGDGTITLSTPQDIHTGATPEFISAKFSGLTASRLLRLGATNIVASVTDFTVWIAGTANRVSVADDGDGSVTLTTPQDTHTGASPTFVAATLSGLTASRLMASDGSKLTVSVADFTNWISGTAGQIAVTDDGDGTVTLSFTAGRIVTVSRYTANQLLDSSNHHVACDTDGGGFTITLPAGVVGTEYRISNTGTSGNDLTITPDGAELLIGVNTSFILTDGETLHIVYESVEGWF